MNWGVNGGPLRGRRGETRGHGMVKTVFSSNIIAPLVLAALAALGPSARPAAAAPAPMTAALHMELRRLRSEALGGDSAASRAAIDRMQAMGPAARGYLFGAVRDILKRDQTVIGRASRLLGDPEKARAVEQELIETRAAARENIRKLAKGEPLRRAEQYHAKLKEMTELLDQVYQVRLPVLEALRRRAELLAIYRDLAPPRSRLFGEEAEAALVAEGEAALGMTVEEAAAIPPFGEGKAPDDPSRRLLWFYRACRQIEAYNRTLRPLMSEAEYENVRFVNRYREYLGILPYEVDPRLLQSARRHSKEMVDLGYFSHASPTAANKSMAQRMKNAGYPRGFSENIALGSRSGERTFWQWFSSPPHHQNMVNPGSVHLGVGHWDGKWTQNMGRADRLMLLPEAEWARHAPKGDIVPPQGGGIAAGPHRPESGPHKTSVRGQ